MGPFEPAATIEAHGYHGPVISLRTTVNPLPEFWPHAEIVLGRKFTVRPEYYRCAC